MTILIYSYKAFYQGMFQCKAEYSVAYNMDFHLLHIEKHLKDPDFNAKDYVDLSIPKTM